MVGQLIKRILIYNKKEEEMFLKIKDFLWCRDYYKIIAVALCMNCIFAVVYKYRFETKIDIIYFIILAVISVFKIKNMIEVDEKKSLSIFYCIWPIIILFISFLSLYRLPLITLVISSFIIIVIGRFKRRYIKILIISIWLILCIAYLFWGVLFFMFNSVTTIVECEYSHDNKYIMVLEETSTGATGGYVFVSIGRNIDFGFFGTFMPQKVKYHGRWGERPEFHFVDDEIISINGELIKRRGGDYIDDY
ncbi:MAG: hypothetical protein ACRDBO_04935 [Lachnospiraceae bacterium]